MTCGQRTGVALLVLAGLLATVPIAHAATKVKDVTAQVARERITVSARLVGGLPPKLVAQIDNGVPKELFYTVALMRRHRRFFDEELLARTVRFHIKYDTLEDRYTLTRTIEGGEAEVEPREVTADVASWEMALGFLSQVDEVFLPRPADFDKHVHYVRVKAEMQAAQLPLYLDYVLFFIPILEFKTPWTRTGGLPVTP